MAKFLREKKVVVLLNGRHAGKKAVINDKASGKKFSSALVCGIERYPLKVTKAMSAKKVERRSRIKPFVKLVNLAHVMPTRYSLDAELKETVTMDLVKDASKKKEARKSIKKMFEEKHKSGQNKWFFQKLRF